MKITVNDAHCHYGNESLMGRIERGTIHSNNPYEKIRRDLDTYEIQNQVLFAQPCPSSTVGYIKGTLWALPRGLYSGLQQFRDNFLEWPLGKSNTDESKIFFGNVDYSRANREICRLEDSRIKFVPFVNSHFNPSELEEFGEVEGVKFYEPYGDIPDELLKYLNEREMNLVIHLSLDKEPESILGLVEKNDGITFQLAHWAIGSPKIMDALEEYSNLFIDTAASSADIYSTYFKVPFKKIAQEHPDKILFGSDEPWTTLGKEIGYMRSLGLDKTDLEKIMYSNYYQLWK